MQPQNAIRRAKDIVRDMFADENLFNIGLEELEYDERENLWRVTIGFTRQWGTLGATLRAVDGSVAEGRRVYKTISISDDDAGKLISIKNREVAYQ